MNRIMASLAQLSHGRATHDNPAPGGGSAFIEENFDYADTTALLASSLYNSNEDQGDISLISTESFPASGSGKSMQYEFTDPGNCFGDLFGRRMIIPSSRRDIWFEVAIKFSDNFSTTNHLSCGGTTDLKMLLNSVTGGGSRFDFRMGNAVACWVNGYPDNEEGSTQCVGDDTIPDVRDIWSDTPTNRWWRLQLHRKCSSDTNVQDGRADFWVIEDDDTTFHSHTAFGNLIINRTSISNIQLGSLFDFGTNFTSHIWIGRVRVWDSDPGFPGLVS